MAKIFLSLGSSLGNREHYLESALFLISHDLGKILKQSCFYETQPWGFSDQNLFLNLVIVIESNLTPIELLKKIHEIETTLNRTRNSDNYEARTIDIDILYYGNEFFNSEKLQIPHKHMHQRKFVLQPLNEIAPEYIHPVLKKTTNQLLNNCTDNLEVVKFS
jgi:2-amino-4-hydroxy-6-hydroxymethyldihydropteridine diphosphokinase